MKLLAIFLFVFAPLSLFAEPIKYGQTVEEQETIQWAFEKAQKFSQITSIDPLNGWKRVPILILSKDELSKTACPDDSNSCTGLAALYDTTKKVIYVREDLHPDSNLMALSFLIHEMVHALQNETRTDEEMFGTCEKLFNTEKMAYDAQDAFLKSEGQFFRAGGALRFFICDEKNKASEK